jgi:hypothetical protein
VVLEAEDITAAKVKDKRFVEAWCEANLWYFGNRPFY